MKKLLSIILAVAMVVSLFAVSAFAEEAAEEVHFNIDSFMVDGTGTNYNTIKKDDQINMVQGQTLTVLGWAYKIGTNLKRVYWQGYDAIAGGKMETSPINDCSNVYRSRNDVADYFYGEAAADYYQYMANSGFGLDTSYMELLGVSELPVGEFNLRVVAEFEDGTTQVMIKRFKLVVEEGTPAAQPTVKVTVGKETTDVKPDAVAQIALSMDGDKLVCKSADDASDPWISIPLDNVDTNVYTSVTVKYTLDTAIFGNNVYLRDTSVNTGYSGAGGTWAPPEMTGKTEMTYVFADSFGTMAGTTLTGIRFPGAAAGGTLVIESITFNAAETAPETTTTEPATQETQPQTGDASVALLAVAALLAMSAAVVFMKKRAF